jgi:UPF0716 protein FxsA
MPLLLLLVFIVVPLVELYVIIQVGEAIGVLPTIGLLLLDSILGTWLLRTQGGVAWGRFNAAIAEGRVPARETLDGALVILGGAFLLTPGFVTDVFGVIFLLPPTRAVARRVLVRMFSGRFRFVMAAPGAARQWRSRGGGRARRDESYDVEGTAHDVDHDIRRLP